MALRFQFDERKGTEALAYITSRWPGITAFFTSKVLFVAEKKHLNRYARPIIADTFIAMPAGPVPSTLYDFMRDRLGMAEDPEAVRAAIDASAYPRLHARRDADLSSLTISDIECLNEAISFCRDKGFGALSGWTHQERAWAEAASNGPMDYEKFVDADNPARDQILEDAAAFAAYGVL
ncbi:Panacea domain-containing protein [uncultured Sphingomonas sp.]|uniref:Panacea domain-containing protein n=1 Tax=uncultured Sphingomonas sp. TaxID=158754 RepID=UPI0035C99F80